jgi:hypothetical protein
MEYLPSVLTLRWSTTGAVDGRSSISAKHQTLSGTVSAPFQTGYAEDTRTQVGTFLSVGYITRSLMGPNTLKSAATVDSAHFTVGPHEVRYYSRVSSPFEALSNYRVTAPHTVYYRFGAFVEQSLGVGYDVTSLTYTRGDTAVEAPAPVRAAVSARYDYTQTVSASAEVPSPAYATVRQSYSAETPILGTDYVAAAFVVSNPMADTSDVAVGGPPAVSVLIDPEKVSRLSPGAAINPDGSADPFYLIVDYLDIAIDFTEGDPVWSCAISLAHKRDRALMTSDTVLRVNVSGDQYEFLVDSLSMRRGGGDPTLVTVVHGVSRTAQKESPRTQPVTRTWDEAATARSIVEELVGGSVVWGLPEWHLPAFRVAIDRGDPVGLAQGIVAAVGGVLEPDETNGMDSFKVRPLFPHWVSLYGSASTTPDVSLGTAEDILDLTSTYDIGDFFNKLRIAETGDPGYSDVLEFTEDEKDPEWGSLRAFFSPWADEAYVTHTGSATVSVVPGGVTLGVETEIVEIVEGSGTTRYPIYSVGAVEWLKANLLGVVFAEGGREVETTHGTLKYSLVRLTYTTKYRDHRVYSPDDDFVQFLANRPAEGA